MCTLSWQGYLLPAEKQPSTPDPGLRRSLISWFRSGAEGWELRHEEAGSRPGRLVQVDVDRNGHCHLFCDRAAEILGPMHQERRIIFEDVILGCLASLLALAGDLYRRAGYVGAVDFGIHVGNLDNGLSFTFQGPLGWDPPFFTRDDFRNTQRVTASELAERPRELAMELTRHLTEATMGREFDLWA